jgi:diaminohydroxyphosphoribosylaminopyrimidine deaminase / 5-amino-6-(5-phosphoribosylamino)uracil reductase
MQRCLTLAKKGLGLTYPNPLVGSVIVNKGNIIGEGWHKKAGEAHAEVVAINSVKNQRLLSESTIYVNLEPCSHHGKTPPCADLIVKMKIKNVVIGTIDYNSEVNGSGVAHLKRNGCNVTIGILENESVDINKRFFTFHQKKRPYIILKWAETKDGFIFPEIINKSEKKPIWISNIYSQQLVHKWRTEEEAILVGTTTVLHDNPSLSARKYYGRSPVRITMDKDLMIPKNYNFNDGSLRTFIFTRKNLPIENGNTIFIKIDFSKNINNQILDTLFEKGIQSVIIEGGSKTLQSFIDLGLWDEARIFIGDRIFKKGIKSPKLDGKVEKKRGIINDRLTIYKKDLHCK